MTPGCGPKQTDQDLAEMGVGGVPWYFSKTSSWTGSLGESDKNVISQQANTPFRKHQERMDGFNSAEMFNVHDCLSEKYKTAQLSKRQH